MVQADRECRLSALLEVQERRECQEYHRFHVLPSVQESRHVRHHLTEDERERGVVTSSGTSANEVTSTLPAVYEEQQDCNCDSLCLRPTR